ncbi:MAG: glycine betaine ABC transporter substrate-binding protein [Bacteroidota bacterium]
MMRLKTILKNKSKNELIILAQKVGLRGYSSLNKEELISKLIDEKKKELEKILLNTFWKNHNHHIYGIASIIGLAITLITILSPYLFNEERSEQPVQNGKITIAGKNFLESSILLEIIAIAIEEKTSPRILVERVHNMLETTYCMNSLLKGEIDIYPEYTGTLLSIHLQESDEICQDENKHNASFINSALDNMDNGLEDLKWIGTFGFHNGYTFVMHKERIKELGLDPAKISISDLSKHSASLTIETPRECSRRRDCLKDISRTYSLSFKRYSQEVSADKRFSRLKKSSLDNGPDGIDVIVAFTTDPQLNDTSYVMIKDDKEFYIKYFAGSIVRKEVLEKYKYNGLEGALTQLNNSFISPNDVGKSDADYRMVKLMEAVRNATDSEGNRLITMESLFENNNIKARKELKRIVREWLIARNVFEEHAASQKDG